MKFVIAMFVAGMLSGCAFCTYHGKAVSKTDAARMKKLGMDVVCP